MKYHSILTPALTSLCLLTSTASLASDSTALPVEDPARWFEIEIILFKQISTKEQNKEEFSPQNLSAKKRDALDLLAPYLQPNISSLKQLLPVCNQPQTSLPYNIEPLPFSLEDEENSTDDSELNAEPSAISKEEGNLDSPSMTVEETQSSSEIEASELTQTSATTDQEAESHYTEIVIPNYQQYPSNSRGPLCVIPEDFFQQHLNPEQLEQFNIDGFPVEKLMSTIDGIEQWSDDENGEITWASKEPYLISKGSLRLKPIANSIRRSRNYAPLLHLGWRQIGETRRQAKAMKLYAGQNLNLDYQQAIAEQSAQQTALAVKAILEKRQTLNNDIANHAIDDTSAGDNTNASVNGAEVSALKTSDEVDTDTPVQELTIEEELRQQAKQQQLDNLFQQFAQLKKDESEVSTTDIAEVERIVTHLAADITKPVTQLFDEGSVQDKPVTLEAPQQAWSLDGLFKVHLDRYLYLNSEFNIIEPSANISNTQKNSQADKSHNEQQVISFKQDRRLITGEIHYFDHPHIGMVIQIRRFDPSKPADEAVTQAKK